MLALERLRRGFWRAARVSPLGGREEGYVAIGILCSVAAELRPDPFLYDSWILIVVSLPFRVPDVAGPNAGTSGRIVHRDAPNPCNRGFSSFRACQFSDVEARFFSRRHSRPFGRKTPAVAAGRSQRRR